MTSSDIATFAVDLYLRHRTGADRRPEPAEVVRLVREYDATTNMILLGNLATALLGVQLPKSTKPAYRAAIEFLEECGRWNPVNPEDPIRAKGHGEQRTFKEVRYCGYTDAFTRPHHFDGKTSSELEYLRDDCREFCGKPLTDSIHDRRLVHRYEEPDCCKGCIACPTGCRGCSGCQRDCECYEHAYEDGEPTAADPFIAAPDLSAMSREEWE